MVNIREEDAEGDDHEKEETSSGYFGSDKVHLSIYQGELELRVMWHLGWTLSLGVAGKDSRAVNGIGGHVVMHMDWLANREANLVCMFLVYSKLEMIIFYHQHYTARY